MSQCRTPAGDDDDNVDDNEDEVVVVVAGTAHCAATTRCRCSVGE